MVLINNLQRAALLMSLVQYDKILGQQQLVMVNYACAIFSLNNNTFYLPLKFQDKLIQLFCLLNLCTAYILSQLM